MKTGLIKMAALASALSIPAAALAQQGAVTGGAAGAVGGAIIGGPVGAVVGGGVGMIVGGIADESRPRFRSYVIEERQPNRVAGEVRLGATLPASGVAYYEVPPEYGVREYRYAYVNDRVVLVEPGTRRIVQIIE